MPGGKGKGYQNANDLYKVLESSVVTVLEFDTVK